VPSALSSHPSRFGRRNFLRAVGIAGVAVGGASVLAACGSDSGSSSSTSSSASAAGFGTASVQLSWIKNVEFAGEYFATEKGYYTDAGFDKVTLLAGGGNTGAEEVVISGQALVGMSSPSITAPAIVSGAPIKIIGSTYQKNPFCILSLAEKTPIKTVADLKGKRMGVQSGGNQAIFEGFLKANGMTTADVKLVTVQYDPTVLEGDTIDGFMAYLTNEPIIMKGAGFTPVTLGLADNGLSFVAETFTVSQESIDTKRDMLKAFLKAEIKGWTDAVKDPGQSADYAVNTYGKDQKLDLKEQTSEATAQNALVLTEDVNTNGLFTMTDALVEENIKALTSMGVTITADKLFDLSLIQEVYKENPDLITKFDIPAA
jgi:ABC-type nitrate/sulfonate/bicarbonate transport system substrate-binding protein